MMDHGHGGALAWAVVLLPGVGAFAAPPTWAGDVRPMIERCCIRCHDGTGPGAYPLRTPAQVAAKRGTILKVLELHSMPPFLPTQGSLVARPPEPTQEEAARFVEWCALGAPIGADTEPARVAPPKSRPAGSAPIRVRLSEGFTITPEEQRTMRSFQAPLSNDAPLLIGGVRVAFDEPGVIARIHLNAVPEAEARRLDELDSAPGYRLTGDGNGSPSGALAGCGIDGVFDLPDGYALAIAPHSALVAEAHADGRGKIEAGGFTVELDAPTAIGDQPIRVCEAQLVAAQGAESDVSAGLTHTIRSAPTTRDAELVALSMRPGTYATAASLTLTRPGEEPIVVIDLPRFDIHQDRPYTLREPQRVPAGSRFTLATQHATDVVARKSIPQAVLLVVPSSPAGGPIDTLDVPGAVDARAGANAPGAVDARAGANGPGALARLRTHRVGGLEVTDELDGPTALALIGRAGLPSTGGVAACGLTWFDAVLAANALSKAMGLTPRYEVASVHADPATGAVTGAIVRRLKGDGWRLPTDAEWSAMAVGNTLPDLVGSVWEWCDTEERERRVVRGGCWADTPAARTAGARAVVEPSTQSELFGARLVRPVRTAVPQAK